MGRTPLMENCFISVCPADGDSVQSLMTELIVQLQLLFEKMREGPDCGIEAVVICSCVDKDVCYTHTLSIAIQLIS